MAAKLGAPFRVFSLDTGRLHPETYQFLEKVRTHYGVTIEAYAPQAEAVQALVREKGLFSFYQDGHKECCGIRKVEPLVARSRRCAPGSRGSARIRVPARAPTCRSSSSIAPSARPTGRS